MMTKTIAVVGAGPGLGLGLSIAKRFGRDGYQVALFARHQGKLDGLVAGLADEGITAAGFVADVTEDASMEAAFAAAGARFGHIDVLEYSPVQIPASTADYAPLGVVGLTAEVAQKNFSIIALGAVSAVGQVLPGMLERGSGPIILTTGISSKGFAPMIGAWGMGGAALRNYARTLAIAVKERGIFVGHVSLGVQIKKGDEHGDPDMLAERIRAFEQDRGRPELVIEHMPPGMITWDKGD
jgi:NAD(P)-dependent dehydrogenase (short-subunit alcohol dehydrogenase family)